MLASQLQHGASAVRASGWRETARHTRSADAHACPAAASGRQLAFGTSVAGASMSRQLLRQRQHSASRASVGCQIVCMANQRRVQMVQKQLMRELSTMLLTDKRVRNAVLPEERLGADGTLSTLVSVTDVRMSGDLQVAKIYISVFGPEGHGEYAAMAGLQRVEGYIRSQVGKAMGLQRVPELRFFLDDSHIRATKVQTLLEGLQAERPGEGDSEEEEGEDDGVILVK